MFEDLFKISSFLIAEQDYDLAEGLCSATINYCEKEEKKIALLKYNKKLKEILKVSKELRMKNLSKLADQMDVIARDIESKIIFFEESDPISSTLSSYLNIHRLASKENDLISELINLAENDFLTENEIEIRIKEKLLGLDENEKVRIKKFLEKEYDITFLEDYIKKATKKEKMTKNIILEKKDYTNKSKEVEEFYEDREKNQKKDKLTETVPALPIPFPSFVVPMPLPREWSNGVGYWTIAQNSPKLKGFCKKT